MMGWGAREDYSASLMPGRTLPSNRKLNGADCGCKVSRLPLKGPERAIISPYNFKSPDFFLLWLHTQHLSHLLDGGLLQPQTEESHVEWFVVITVDECNERMKYSSKE